MSFWQYVYYEVWVNDVFIRRYTQPGIAIAEITEYLAKGAQSVEIKVVNKP